MGIEYLKWTALAGFYVLLLVYAISWTSAPGVVEKELLWSALGRLPLLIYAGVSWRRKRAQSTSKPLLTANSPLGWLLFIVPLILLLQIAVAKKSLYLEGGTSLLILFVSSVLMVAMVEELIFRAHLLLGVINRTNFWRILGLSSLFFALVHAVNIVIYEATFSGVLSQMIFALLVGGYLGTLVWFSGKLWMAILLHASINLTLSTQRLQEPVFEPGFTLSTPGFVLMIALFLLTIYSVVFARRRSSPRSSDK